MEILGVWDLKCSQDDLVCDKVPIVDTSSSDVPDNDNEDDTEDDDADVEAILKILKTKSERTPVYICMSILCLILFTVNKRLCT